MGRIGVHQGASRRVRVHAKRIRTHQQRIKSMGTLQGQDPLKAVIVATGGQVEDSGATGMLRMINWMDGERMGQKWG